MPFWTPARHFRFTPIGRSFIVPMARGRGSNFSWCHLPTASFFGLGYVLYCVGHATRRMVASVLAALLRATIAVVGGHAVISLKADVTWNFVAVSVGMVAGPFALPPLINRTGMGNKEHL